MDLKNEFGGVASTDSEQGQVAGCCELSSSIKGREFLNQISDYRLFKLGSTPWRTL